MANLARADAVKVEWDVKYHYELWRPVTAIRQADTDGNPLTVVDENWVPLGFVAYGHEHVTPPFPTYGSGHSCMSGAFFTLLSQYFRRDRYRFNAQSDQLPGVTRTFTRFSEAADEMGMSRIYLGVHFPFDHPPAPSVSPFGRSVPQQLLKRFRRR